MGEKGSGMKYYNLRYVVYKLIAVFLFFFGGGGVGWGDSCCVGRMP